MPGAPALSAAVALLLAGCVAPGPTPGPGEGEGPAPPQAWGLVGCTFAIVTLPVDAARLAAHLPPGFQPAREGTLRQLRGATLSMDVYQCERGLGLLGTPEGPVTYGSYYAAVDPPEAMRGSDPEVNGWFVKWDVLVQNATARAWLADAGLPAHAGEGAVDLGATPAGGPVQARLAFDQGGGFTATGTVAGTSDPAAYDYLEFTPTAARALAVWHAHANPTGAVGPVAVTLEPGSWVAEVVGATEAAGTVYAGQWEIHDATLTLPG